MDKPEEKKIPYVRVGTQYYKYVSQPLVSGDTVAKLIAWNVETITRDNGKTYVGEIPTYDGFCLIPEHINYNEVIANHLNRYEPIPWKPEVGDCSLILFFL